MISYDDTDGSNISYTENLPGSPFGQSWIWILQGNNCCRDIVTHSIHKSKRHSCLTEAEVLPLLVSIRQILTAFATSPALMVSLLRALFFFPFSPPASFPPALGTFSCPKFFAT
jgi:hypothetical protein